MDIIAYICIPFENNNKLLNFIVHIKLICVMLVDMSPDMVNLMAILELKILNMDV